MSAGKSSTCFIEPDSDVIGVGIRISIYILSLSNPLILFFLRSTPLPASIESSLGVTGLALFLTTIINTALGDFNLFHALCVLHLLGLVGLSISPKGQYAASRARTLTFALLYVIAASGSLAYFIYVFVHAHTFGSQPECNDETIYVLFGVDIQATNDVIRWIFVASFAILAVGFAVWLLVMGCLGCCGRLREAHGDVETGYSHSQEEVEGGEKVVLKLGGFIRMFGQLGACVYMIVMLELMIRRNRLLPGIGEWRFGQVLAVVMLVGPLIEVLSLVLGGRR